MSLSQSQFTDYGRRKLGLLYLPGVMFVQGFYSWWLIGNLHPIPSVALFRVGASRLNYFHKRILDKGIHSKITASSKLSISKCLMLNLFFHCSSDLKTLLPVKIPSEYVTRAWTGHSSPLNSFESSFRRIKSIIYEKSSIQPLTNLRLTRGLKSAFCDINPITRCLEISHQS